MPIHSSFAKSVGAALLFAATALPAPITVQPVRGNYCRAFAPRGWMVTGENPQRSAFGADLLSADGQASAGYAVFPGGTLVNVRGWETPDRAVASWLTASAGNARFGNPRQIGPNVWLMEYQTRAIHGVGFFQVYPTGRGGFMILLRTANTAINLWQRRAGEASAAARSLHCNVPNVPAQPDPKELDGPKRRGGQASGESDSLYNQWLDKEYYHNPKTGENFWVSPSTDYQTTGPEGPGYYAQHGNTYIKLDSGYSQ